MVFDWDALGCRYTRGAVRQMALESGWTDSELTPERVAELTASANRIMAESLEAARRAQEVLDGLARDANEPPP